jgi:uncharacterized protein YkwD
MPRVRRAGVPVGIALALVALTATPSWAGRPTSEPPPSHLVQPWMPHHPAPWLSGGGSGWPHRPGEGTVAPRPREPRKASARARVISAVNQHRVQAGCRPVSGREALHRAARGHSFHLSRVGRLSHRGRGGSSPGDRVRAAGYRPGPVGENLVAGPSGPRQAVRSWMRSSPHRAILLDCEYSHAGVGVARGRGGPWWTLVLASRR